MVGYSAVPATPEPVSDASPQRTAWVLADFPSTFLEKNLATTGYFSAGRQRPGTPSVKRIAYQRRQDGVPVEVVVEILGNGRDLLPNTLDLKLHLAWMAVYRRDCARARRVLERHEFASTDLLRELPWTSDSGVHYRDVARFVRVSTTTSIVSTQAIYLKRIRRYVTDCFRVFDRALGAGQQFEDGHVLDRNQVHLSSWFLENLERSYVVGVDFARMHGLTKGPALLLAAMLPFWSYVARHDRCFQKRYQDLCALLGIRCYDQRSKAVEKLGPSLDELKRLEFIAGWQLDRMRDDDLKVVIWVRPRLVAVRPSPRHVPPATAQKEPAPAGRTPDSDLTELLGSRGVHRVVARRVLSEVRDAGAVERQIARFDRLVASERGATLRNPAGFLVSLIRDGEAAPRQSAPPGTRPERPRPNHYQLLQAYKRYVQDAVAEHVAALPAPELEQLVDAHLPTVREEDDRVQGWPLDLQRQAARHRLERHLAKTLPVQRLHEFLAAHECAGDETEALS